MNSFGLRWGAVDPIFPSAGLPALPGAGLPEHTSPLNSLFSMQARPSTGIDGFLNAAEAGLTFESPPSRSPELNLWCTADDGSRHSLTANREWAAYSISDSPFFQTLAARGAFGPMKLSEVTLTYNHSTHRMDLSSSFTYGPEEFELGFGGSAFSLAPPGSAGEAPIDPWGSAPDSSFEHLYRTVFGDRENPSAIFDTFGNSSGAVRSLINFRTSLLNGNLFAETVPNRLNTGGGNIFGSYNQFNLNAGGSMSQLFLPEAARPAEEAKLYASAAHLFSARGVATCNIDGRIHNLPELFSPGSSSARTFSINAMIEANW